MEHCQKKQRKKTPLSFEFPGAPNDQFVAKCIIITQLMKINVIKAFSGVFQCCWENIICSFFPARQHRKFPSQLDKIGWFPSQLIKFIFQPGIPHFQIPRSKTTEQKRQNRDKTGFFRKRNHSDQPSYVCDYSLGEGRGSFFFFFFSRPQSSEFLQPARIEMLEKVSNSQAKPLSITKFPSQLIETPIFLPASKITPPEQIM